MAMTGIDVLAAENRASRFGFRLRESFRLHGLFFALPLFYLLAFKVAGIFNSNLIDGDPFWMFISIMFFSTLVALLAMVIMQFYFVAAVDKSEKPISGLYRRMVSVLRHHDTMVRGIPMFLALLIFMYAFTFFKANVTNFIPFAWDVTFDRWDQVLHFGTRPWEWLQPVFGNVVGTLILNVNYNLWFMVMQLFWIYFGFIQKPGLDRTRFYVSFFFTWSIGGSLMAILFSSAGPCYYHLVVGGIGPYQPLMQQLRDFNAIVPIWAVDTQAMLWGLHSNGSIMGGVTAMPSMHNATALLFVLTTWNMSKRLRNLLIVHMILIFLGSVHLGWHYAVDAYFAWAITLVLWVAAHHIAKRWEAQPKIQSFNAQCSSNI